MPNQWHWRRWGTSYSSGRVTHTYWHITKASLGPYPLTRCGLRVYLQMPEGTGPSAIEPGQPAPPKAQRCRNCMRGIPRKTID